MRVNTEGGGGTPPQAGSCDSGWPSRSLCQREDRPTFRRQEPRRAIDWMEQLSGEGRLRKPSALGSGFSGPLEKSGGDGQGWWEEARSPVFSH